MDRQPAEDGLVVEGAGPAVPAGHPSGVGASHWWEQRRFRYGAVVLAGVLVMVVLVNFAARANNPTYPTDDGYIAFAYAHTLATHGQLALTPGAVPVQGYSDFLWVVVLATFDLLGVTIPTASRIVGVLCLVALMPATYLLVRRLAPIAWKGLAVAAALVAGFLPGGIFFAVSGLETSLAALLLTLGLASLVADRWSEPDAGFPWVAGICLLGYALVRPEGILLWGLLTVGRFASLHRPFFVGQGRRLVQWLAFTLVPFALYELWQVWYFGSPIPNTIPAKRGTPLGQTLRDALPYLHGFFFPLAVFVVLALVGLSERSRAVLVAALAIVATVAVTLFTAVGDGYPYQRYLYVAAPAILALAAVGGWRISRWAWATRHGLGVAAVGLILVVGGIGIQREFADSPSVTWSQLAGTSGSAAQWTQFFAADTGPHQADYPGYFAASAWLLKNARPGQSIALGEIGIVSYYSRLHVIDTFGLANATIAHQPGLPAGKVDGPYVFGLRPTYFATPLVPATSCLCLNLPADQAYSRTALFAFGYDLAGLFPSDPRQVAVFERHPGLETVNSLDSLLTHPMVMTVPPEVAVAADSAVINAEVQDEARYALLGTVEGATGTSVGGSAVTEFTVGVPESGVTEFVVGVGSTTDPDGGSWSIRAVSPRGVDQVLTTVSRPGQTVWQPEDVGVSLNPWRGQVIQLQLEYRGAVAGLDGRPAFVEPRMLLTSAPRD